MRRAIAIGIVAALVAPAATARDRSVWSVTRTADPITGDSSCVVAAVDRAAGMSFTRVGVIYPIVELNSRLGLLVGVSSGGRVRLPTGNIVWRVDDLPYRELKAADNPADRESALPANATDRMTRDTLALTRALTATSTVASGDTAWAMLGEMRRGHALQFRQTAAAAGYGLPQDATQETGQITKKGLRPYPLDASFQTALSQCGIGERPETGK